MGKGLITTSTAEQLKPSWSLTQKISVRCVRHVRDLGKHARKAIPTSLIPDVSQLADNQRYRQTVRTYG
eukprot:41696-Eustigmatos_ZCMA.PRE.1